MAEEKPNGYPVNSKRPLYGNWRPFGVEIIAEIRNRLILKNENYLLIITGRTGIGKSYAGMRLAELIQPSFAIEQVVFTHQQFLELINSGQLRRGDVILWDEVGVGHSSRSWYTAESRAVNDVVETFRHKNFALIMTCPDLMFIDKRLRLLAHAVLDLKSKDKNNGICWGKYFNLEPNSLLGKLYIKYPNLEGNQLRKFGITYPSNHIVREYENKKTIFTSSITQRSTDTVANIGRIRPVKEEFEPEKIAEQIYSQLNLFLNSRDDPDVFKMMNKFKISKHRAEQVKRIVNEMISNKLLLDNKESVLPFVSV